MKLQEEVEEGMMRLVPAGTESPRSRGGATKSRSTRLSRACVEIATPLGTLRGRHQIKAAVQSLVFACLISGYGVYHVYSTAGGGDRTGAENVSRQLVASNTTAATAANVACANLGMANPRWMCVFYAMGVLYMFLALAIACDEFFVPALEEMSSPRRLNLSTDVAGATLMAAGGSAPELFTALFGTFQESAVGFGTIVGSAVFNVLFVIAMCSLLAREVLSLTWWPLFRDSLYYAVGLVVLAVFSGVHTKDQIDLWEAIVLFAMYLGYILIMWQNANIYKALTGKVWEYPDEDDDDDEEEEAGDGTKDQAAIADINGKDKEGSHPRDMTGMKRSSSKQSVLSNLSARALEAQGGGQAPPHFRWQGTFRAGILKLLKDPESWMDTAGVGIVAKIAGDADYVFQQVDMDGNGHVDHEELRQLFNLLECYISPAELEEVFNELDEDKDGTVSAVNSGVGCGTIVFLGGQLEPHCGIYFFVVICVSFVFQHYRLVSGSLQIGIVGQKSEFCLKSVMSLIRLMPTNRTPSTRRN